MRVLRNARLADGRAVDVHTDDGLITAVAAAGSPAPEGAEIDDLAGWLLLPALAEPHSHLDKALTATDVGNPTGDLLGAIEAWSAAASAGLFTYENIVNRASQALELLLVHGVTAVRSHVNALGDPTTVAVAAVREAADRFAGLMDVQIVALSGFPLTGSDSIANRRALAAALEAGVDLVGGCPHLDPDGPGLIAYALDAAADAGLGIDLHVDEMLDPGVLTLRSLARQVHETGFAHPVAASHCVSLGMQPPDVQAAVAAEVAEAEIAVITLPQTNLYLQGRHHPTATPRGLTAIDTLRHAGTLVAAGADNVQDPYNPVGRSDPLETAALLVMAAHQTPETAYDMVSNNARRAMGLAPVNFEPGDPAELTAIDATSVRAAVADAAMSRRTYHQGRLVASTNQHTTVGIEPVERCRSRIGTGYDDAIAEAGA